MAKNDKRLDKARQNPQNVSFAELDTILQSQGFVLARITGSHHIYRHEQSGVKLTIPSHSGKVKQVYVKEAINAIDALSEDSDD